MNLFASLIFITYVALSLLARLNLAPRAVQYYIKLTHYGLVTVVAATYGLLLALFAKLFDKDLRLDISYYVGRVMVTLGSIVLGVDCVVSGGEFLENPEFQAVLVGNHQATLDMITMSAIFPRHCTVMAKKSLRAVPVLGAFMAATHAVFVDRGNSAKARQAMDKAIKEMNAKKLSLFVYPEGTRARTRERTMLPFKKGAFHLAVQAQIPIVPVVFSAYDDIFDSKAKSFVGGTVHIKVLPPIPTEGIAIDDKETINELLTETREMMIATYIDISAKVPTPGAPDGSSSSSDSDDEGHRRHPLRDSVSIHEQPMPINGAVEPDSLVQDQKMDREDGYLDDYAVRQRRAVGRDGEEEE
ncbi:1-acylglycerol-3-phosphate O-acyltransferase [Allomyces macrogynus ATCC 38327]|uniref:1-acyl-sn-glycerol-3-phosphate acyltransferase n=1 Tax=Allomyces macrogynus (strain ATCC 38327) TaxID=578462 RepID=A0A0L0T0Z6_ALLM3|nr:1-acylglycerol-3-phosphate O-acyltransferase [Allomyces macrogynus ATCC 38327]|eukprot:KNE68254.1 1-acylglycerol-3-phosphate O-acyltransferase [Allomyces macrogynus ATCC 38327]